MSRFLRFTAPVYLNDPLPDPLPVEVVEVDDAAVQRVLAAHLDAWARPAVELHARPTDAPQPLAASRLGGCPDLPEGMDWPRHAGRPLAFIAQVNLADVAAHDPRHELPPSGLLLFFHEFGGGDGYCRAEDAASLRVLHVEQGTLERRDFPADLPEAQRLAAQAVQLLPALVPPEFNDLTEAQVDALLAALSKELGDAPSFPLCAGPRRPLRRRAQLPARLAGPHRVRRRHALRMRGSRSHGRPRLRHAGCLARQRRSRAGRGRALHRQPRLAPARPALPAGGRPARRLDTAAGPRGALLQ